MNWLHVIQVSIELGFLVFLNFYELFLLLIQKLLYFLMLGLHFGNDPVESLIQTLMNIHEGFLYDLQLGILNLNEFVVIVNASWSDFN